MKTTSRIMLKGVFALSLMLPSALMQAGRSQEAEMLKSIPASSELIFFADISKALKLPLIEEMKKSNPDFATKYADMEQKLSTQGVKVNDIAKSMVIFMDQTGFGGALVDTKLGQDKFEKLLKGDAFGQPANVEVENIQGHKVLVFSGASDNMLLPDTSMAAAMAGIDNDPSKKIMALTFLSKDTALFLERQDMEQYLSAPKGASKDLLSRRDALPKDTLLWMTAKVPETDSFNANPLIAQMSAQNSDIKGVAMSLDFTGKTSEDLAIKLCLDCTDGKAASAQAMKIQQMIWLVAGMQAGDPKLSQSLMNAIKIGNKDNVVSINALITRQIIEKIKENAQKPQAIPGQMPKVEVKEVDIEEVDVNTPPQDKKDTKTTSK